MVIFCTLAGVVFDPHANDCEKNTPSGLFIQFNVLTIVKHGE